MYEPVATDDAGGEPASDRLCFTCRTQLARPVDALFDSTPRPCLAHLARVNCARRCRATHTHSWLVVARRVSSLDDDTGGCGEKTNAVGVVRLHVHVHGRGRAACLALHRPCPSTRRKRKWIDHVHPFRCKRTKGNRSPTVQGGVSKPRSARFSKISLLFGGKLQFARQTSARSKHIRVAFFWRGDQALSLIPPCFGPMAQALSSCPVPWVRNKAPFACVTTSTRPCNTKHHLVMYTSVMRPV